MKPAEISIKEWIAQERRPAIYADVQTAIQNRKTTEDTMKKRCGDQCNGV
jgi:hypothetical protein